MKIWFFIFYFALFGSVQSQKPDLTPQCLSCEAILKEAVTLFGNATTAAQVLAALDSYCKSEYVNSTEKEQICEDLMEVIVDIPVSLIEGMDSLAWPVPLGFCATIFRCHVECCKTPYTPEQIHIGLTNDLSEMTVMWTTLNITSADLVQWGLSKDALTSQSSGTHETYIAAGWLGTLHRAKMTGLLRNTVYYYRVGNTLEKNGWSSVFSFKTLDPNTSSLNILVFGDMAYDINSDNTILNGIAAVQAGQVDLVLHIGDISYADGFEPHWDNFFNKIQPIAAQVPYMVVPGNHEFWYNFTSYKHRFDMPGVSSPGGSGDSMYYSWSLGPVFFLACNSETAIDTGDFSKKQQAWMESTLAAVDRSKFPFLVVYHHRPMYCSNCQTQQYAAILRAQAEAMYLRHGVDMVLTGHVHDYERTFPMYNWTVVSTSYADPAAPVYVVQGASGNREGNDHNWPSNMPAWSAAHSSAIGFGLMSISRSSLFFQFYQADPVNPILLDKFTITKSAVTSEALTEQYAGISAPTAARYKRIPLVPLI